MDELDKDRAALRWLTGAWDAYLDGLPALLPVIALQVLAAAGSFWLVHRFNSFLPALPYMLLFLTPLSIGVNLFYIRLTRGEPAGLRDLAGVLPVYPAALGVSLLLGLASAAGLFLLVVPGVIIYLTYAFSEYAVVDKRTGVRDSFLFSAALTTGWRLRLFPLFMATAAVNFFVPDIFQISGPLKAPEASLDLRTWTVAGFALKNLVFLPWLHLAAARAYNYLLLPPPPEAEEPAGE